MTVHKHSIEKCLISPGGDIQTKYKKVIIIGNGPSAMNLSFILSGYRPYYEGNILKNTNEMLHYRLSQQPNLHLLEQDLTFLSHGLEGQINNPMALLFDKLTNPGADMGVHNKSALLWRQNGEKPIDHVVLGKGKVGGTWQTMDRSMKTLSQAFLLELPDMPIQEWLEYYRNKVASNETNISNGIRTKARKQTRNNAKNTLNIKNNFKNTKTPQKGAEAMQGRVKVEEMCAYFEEYVQSKGLDKYFRTEHMVVGARKVKMDATKRDKITNKTSNDSGYHNEILLTSDEMFLDKSHPVFNSCEFNKEHCLLESSVSNDCHSVISNGDYNSFDEDDGCQKRIQIEGENMNEMKRQVELWEVYGTTSTGEQFCYRAPRLVLATGSSDHPNRLGVRGESLPGILHSHAEFQQVINKVSRRGCLKCPLTRRIFKLVDRSPSLFEDPVLIVGSGLSAADAVLYAIERGIPVIHMFEKSVEEVARTYRPLSPLLYPEYYRVFDLMSQKVLLPGLYQSLPGVRILSFLDDKKVSIQECDRSIPTTISASLVIILIGSSPNLSFLPDAILNTLFTPPSRQTHKQLVSVDSMSYQSRQHKGLYAMGPLVGENYVRFLGGGAFAISADIIKQAC